jgi:nucleoid DNA-binding protein
VELANYLKLLLYNHDSVHIPGLGTMSTRYKHAEINTSEKTMSPPSKFLVFDTNNQKEDHLLINYISNEKQLTDLQATLELKKVIDDLLKRLNLGETVLLEGIGYFSKEEGKIRFEKEQDANFLTESFGLTKIDFEPVEFEYTPYIPEILPKPRKRYTGLIISLILFVLAGSGIVFYLNCPDLINLRTKRISKPSIRPVIDTTKQAVLKDTTKQTVVKDTTEKTNIEKFYESVTDKKNALSIPTPSADDKNKYYIIAGSFLTDAKAQELAKEIEKEGYKTKIIRFGEKIRISLGEYTSKEKALEDLQKIRYSKGDNSVWLLTVPTAQ